jgi:hypothetical protein
MNRAFFEGLDSGARLELLCRLHAMTVELAERLGKNSTNSSKPSSSDSPFSGLPYKEGDGQKEDVKGSVGAKPWTPPSGPSRRPGKQPGLPASLGGYHHGPDSSASVSLGCLIVSILRSTINWC